MTRIDRRALLVVCGVALLAGPAGAQSVLFDFDSTPQHTPLPLSLTVGGVTANLSATGQGFAIQAANSVGFTPAGFAGNCIYPSSVFPSDLQVGFSRTILDISILFAPSELACDTTATMRITGYKGGVQVGTSTAQAPTPGTYPTGTLTLSAAQGFDSVVIHYETAPAVCDSAPVFLADNLTVTPQPPPAMSFFALTPCRVLDTRHASGPDAAAPALAAGAERPFTLSGRCAIPATAKSVSVNLTAVAAAVAGNLVVYPGNASPPLASLLNFPAALARGNNAVVKLAPDGTVKVLNRAGGTVDFILDVNGYFE
jgi:hypothetical protein